MPHRVFLLLCSLGIIPAAHAQKKQGAGVLELQGTEWAGEKMLGSPVAISVDHLGRAYVTQTVRRKESELDIRSHTDWVTATLALESVADREAFYRSQLSAVRSEQNKSWLKDRNHDGISDFRDLGVLSEKVLRISDRSSTGVADTSEVFVDGLAHEMTGVAAGVMSYDGSVYLAAIPDVWKFDENRKLGSAPSEKEKLLYGFGVHIAYSGHDMHGFTVGPDGRIYWTIGDKGVNVTLPDGTQHKYAHQGCVMRCEPDGSGFEIFAHGLRNPQEIAFDEFGNLFSVDNDGDFKGERERFVYITEQSDSGWRCNWQYRGVGYNPWMDEKLAVPQWQGQAAYITPPLQNYSDGPCGFVYNPGTALGEKWRNTYFLTQFPGRKLTAFQTEPVGASFRMVHERLVYSGPMMTGLSWGPDGALYVADWNSAAWEPHDKGKIWKLDVLESERDSQRKETQALLAAGVKTKSVEDLQKLCGHADQRVRLAAQFSLVNQQQDKLLLALALKNPSRLARVHGIWGLGQLGRRDPSSLTPLLPLLRDNDEEIRAQVAKVLGDAHAKESSSQLLPLLADKSKRVQFHAAMALAKSAGEEVLSPLVAWIESIATTDVVLRHAAITALAGAGRDQPQKLAAFTNSAHEQVRLCAVVALRRLGAAEVQNFLKDDSALIVAEAARAIHDDESLPNALPALAKMLDQNRVVDPIVLRRAISANLRLGGDAAALRLANFAVNPQGAQAMRQEALASLASWTKPAALDRVEGRYRPLSERSATELLPALEKNGPLLLSDRDEAVRVATCALISHSNYTKANTILATMVNDEQLDIPSRRAALQALSATKAQELTKSVNLAIHSSNPTLRNEALSILAATGQVNEEVLPLIATILQDGKESEKQDAYIILGAIHSAPAITLLAAHLDDLLAGKIAPTVQLDLLEAAKSNGAPSLLKKITEYQAKKNPQDQLAAFRETLVGGHADQGKNIALNHLAAQCTRCHKIGAEGAEVGPDLSKISERLSREQLLESLVLPNQVLAKGYAPIVVAVKDGKNFSGDVEKESPTQLQLRSADGQLITLEKSTITSRSIAASMMPAMDTMLSAREIRDVIAYLTTLK